MDIKTIEVICEVTCACKYGSSADASNPIKINPKNSFTMNSFANNSLKCNSLK